MRPGLSKSKLTAFLQCPKRLWLSVRKPDEARWSVVSQSSLDMGNQVGELARAEFPDGVLVDTGEDMAAAVSMTRELMRSPAPRPVFEATFESAGVLVRADLVLPVGDGRHDLHEVKAATRAADKYVTDAAIQGWVMREAGVPLRSVHVRHLDKGFVYPGGGRYAGLFASQNVDAACASVAERIPAWVAGARATLLAGEPAVTMGAHCQSPNTCPFTGYCTGSAAPGKVPRLASDPARAVIDHAGARAAMASWSGPRHFLDFETIALAIPRWPGTSPFQRIPFQFSCHIEDHGGLLRHESFVDLSGENPAAGCAEALVRTIGPQGAVIAYGAGAERSAVSMLAQLVPAHRGALLAILERIVDLLPVVRHHYHHPDLASHSLKDVLPTVAPELAHAHLSGVKSGQDAQPAYLEAIAPGTPPHKKAIIEAELVEYCTLDTLALVEIVKRLER
jgi:hypothetical protein